MSGRGFLSRIFGGSADEDETRVFSAEELRTESIGEKDGFQEERLPRGFTVERAAKVIDDLPPDVPRESALRIVRGTLLAAGIEFEDLERSTRTRESRLNSEIDLIRSRQEDLRERAQEVVRSLQEEIRKAWEARDAGIAEEEKNVSRAVRGLEEMRRVRAFFGFPETEEEPAAGRKGDAPLDETQILEPFDDTEGPQTIRGPESTTGGIPYDSHGTTDGR
jgi:chaperonin cofactor prefoldin